MAKVFDAIDDHMRRWIARQRMFFVATAPLTQDGHVNVSPKGPIDTLRVLGDREIAYLDHHGSGNETVAHLRENGRIVVMLCSFEGPPKIVRLHGRGDVILHGDPRFDELMLEWGFEALGPEASYRSIIRVDVDRISDSCGYGVPLMSFEDTREHYELSVSKKVRVKSADGYRAMARERGAHSIDGLPSLAE